MTQIGLVVMIAIIYGPGIDIKGEVDSLIEHQKQCMREIQESRHKYLHELTDDDDVYIDDSKEYELNEFIETDL